MNHTLTQTERDEMTRLLGTDRAGVILEAAERLARAPKAELTGRRHPDITGTGKYLTQVVDPRTGALTRLTVDILERISLDPQIGICLEFIKLPILAMRPEVQHPDPEIKEFLQYELDMQWFKLSREMLTALSFGFVAFEKVYTNKDVTIERDGLNILSRRMVAYEKIKSIHPRGIEFITDDFGNLLAFEQIQGASGRPRIDAVKALIYTYDEQFGNWYGNARTRRAYKPWWWSDLIYQFANRYFEDQSIPQRKIYYEPSPVDPDQPTLDGNKNAALNVAESSRSGAAVALPLQAVQQSDGSYKYEKSWDMEFLMGPNKASEFIPYLDHLDIKKMRGMFVPEKLGASSEGGGAYNMLEVLAEMFLQSEEGLAVDLLDNLRIQWARPLIAYNFGSSAPDCSFVKPKLSKEDKTLVKELFKDMMSKATPDAASAPRIDLEAMASGLGVPLVEQQEGVTGEGNDDNQEGVQINSAPQRERIILESPRPYRGGWEKATVDFETELSETYLEWAKSTARKIDDAPPEDKQTALDDALAVLLVLLLALHRKRLLEAYRMGHSDDLSPDAMQDVARRLQAAEASLTTELIPKLKDKFSQDASDPSTDTLKSLESRSRYVTAKGGATFWGAIFAGLTVAVVNRQQQTGEQIRVRWVLDALVKEHCSDCLGLAGEYASIADLPTLPGNGATECGDYCRCYIQLRINGSWVRAV